MFTRSRSHPELNHPAAITSVDAEQLEPALYYVLLDHGSDSGAPAGLVRRRVVGGVNWDEIFSDGGWQATAYLVAHDTIGDQAGAHIEISREQASRTMGALRATPGSGAAGSAAAGLVAMRAATDARSCPVCGKRQRRFAGGQSAHHEWCYCRGQ